MSNYKTHKQQGAVLMIALIMLLVLTLLALSSMRDVNLETRITAARLEDTQLAHLVEAALREGEFRLYGDAHLRDKLEPDLARNCVKANTLDVDGQHRPCLLLEMSNEQLQDFFSAPIRFFKTSNSYTAEYANKTGLAVQAAAANAVVAWMPYRGLDAQTAHYFVAANDKYAYWNSYRISSESAAKQTLNPEYGAALEGKGTFYYLVTAQAEDTVAAQSTVAVIHLGLNNGR
ncbi:pilus assembly protein PilX [Denitrificimonas caeni]|uniref:pilus assembly protein PilX n=1 Tax=Denitrificimonas caeni TaxID=521720 RepID=UPI00196419E4|nr:pilus assembly protein PilX [Denitrificimonas caeni]